MKNFDKGTIFIRTCAGREICCKTYIFQHATLCADLQILTRISKEEFVFRYISKHIQSHFELHSSKIYRNFAAQIKL